MEYGWNLWLKISHIMCRYTTIIFFEIPPCAHQFLDSLIYFNKGRIFAWNYKCRNKNGLLCAWRDFQKNLCDVSTYDKWNFKPQISSIFHFERVSDGWMAHVLGVNVNTIFILPIIESKTFVYVYVKYFFLWKVVVHEIVNSCQYIILSGRGLLD